MKRLLVLMAVIVLGSWIVPWHSQAQSEKQGIAIYNQAEAMRDVPRSKEDLEKALAMYMQALEIFQKTGSVGWQGVAWNDMGLIFSKLGQYQKALEHYERALALHKKAGNTRAEATTVNNIGVIHVQLGQYQKAMECYDKSLVLARKSENLRAEGWTLAGIGAVHKRQGQYAKALEYYENALQVQRKARNMKQEAEDVSMIGEICQAWGQYQKALEYYEKALDLENKSGNVRAAGWTYANVGSVYDRLGQYPKALEYYQKSLEIHKKLGNRLNQGYTLNDMGQTYIHMERYDDALARFREALEIHTGMGVKTNYSKELIGNLYLDKGEVDKAEPYLKEANYLRSLGRLSLHRSDYEKAKQQYQGCLEWGEKSKQADELFTAYTGLGKACEGLEDYKKAEEYYEKGMKLTEEIRSALLPSERKNFFEVRIHGFQRSEPAKGLTRVRMKLNQAAGSIDSSEATRARAFSDNIALTTKEGLSGVPAEILRQEDAVVTKVAALKKQLSQTDKEKSPATFENISQQVQQSEAELKAFVQLLWEKYKPYASVKYPRPVTLKESALKDEEYVAVFDVSGDGVGVKLIQGKEIRETAYKKWKQSNLEADVKKFRQSFEQAKLKEFDPDLAESLYKSLLARVLIDVPKGSPLVIIPDGILAVLPFEALVVSGKATWKDDASGSYPEGLTFLGDLYPISYYQSITALTLARTLRSTEKKGAKTLVIADPVFEPGDDRLKSASVKERQQTLAALPEKLMSIKDQTGVTFQRLSKTTELAESLKKLNPGKTDTFVGMQAKKSVLFDKPLKDYGSIVFATHGYYGTDIPGVREPVLAMTLVDQARGEDGFVRMTEVMGMKLNADVVALTACQTGLGNNLSGEGVMSMGRAFQYAGAKTILMSLWSVSESGSVLLVEKFFEHLREGKTKLDALKSARADVRDSGYRHPFFWAPFIMVGEVD